MNKTSIIKQHWPWISWLLLIFILTGLPSEYVPRVKTFKEWLEYDKLAHILMFGVLVFLALKSFITQYPTNRMRFIYVAVLFMAIVIGAATELMQEFLFTGRKGSLYDFGADALGCLSGMWGFDFLYKKNLKKPDETKNY